MFIRCCLIAFCLCYGLQSGLAQPQSPLNLQVNLDADAQTLFEVFQELEAAYPVRFFYREEWLPRNQVTTDLQNVPLGEVLNQLLSKTQLDYYVFNDYSIFIGRKSELVDFRRPLEEKTTEVLQGPRDLFLQKEKRNIVGDSTFRPLPVRARIDGMVFNPDSDEGLVWGQCQLS